MVGIWQKSEYTYCMNGEIVIYKDANGPELRVQFEDETIWLSQAQMAELFGKDVKTISKHITAIYKEGELERSKTSLKKANSTHLRIGINKPTTYYNLDVVISVGYRVRSKRGVQFRIWATGRLKEYLVKGFLVNQQRLKEQSQAKLKELEGAIKLLQQAANSHQLEGYEKELLHIITDYTQTWILLNQYDHKHLQLGKITKKQLARLEYEQVTKSIYRFRTRLIASGEATELFGKEVSFKLKALLGNINQTFDGIDVYPSLEEKAAHLLYFAIKDHPFVDGNKRIGSLLFLLYLVENRALYNLRGEKKINNAALTALALLVAESEPKQKDVMVKLIVNLIQNK